MPAANWPRFWMSNSIRGMSREISSGPCSGHKRTDAPARQVVDRGNAAFLVKFAHAFDCTADRASFTIHLTGGGQPPHTALTGMSAPRNRSRDGKGTEEVFSSDSRHKGKRFSENLLRPPHFSGP